MNPTHKQVYVLRGDMTRDKLVRTAILVAGPRVPPAEGAASAPKTAEAPEAIMALRFKYVHDPGLTMFAVIRTAVTAFHLDRPVRLFSCCPSHPLASARG